MKITSAGIFTILLLLIVSSTAGTDSCLSKGVAPGELYLYGVGGAYPDCVDWLYRSTDSGQTVYLQNDTVLVTLLAEGVAEGELYKTNFNGRISYSDDYGSDFVWKELLGTDLQAIASGYAAGEVYASIYNITKYSTNYGATFMDKGTCPGGVLCMSVGHNPGEIYCGCYHGEVYYSSNYGETYDLVIDLANHIVFRCISRGSEDGEIYLLDEYRTLYYSPNRCDTLYEQHQFDTEFIFGMAAGLSAGEVYAVQSEHYFEGGGDLYIHHSTDYGQTFVTHHVYSAQEDVIPPEAVTDLEATLADNSIVLTWSDINQDIWGNPETIDYYVVYRDTVPDFIPSSEDSIGATILLRFADSEAGSSTSFFYVVEAVDNSGNMSKPSNRVGKMNRLLSH